MTYTNLTPGERYQFYVRTVSGDAESLPLNNSTAVRPAYDESVFGIMAQLAQEPDDTTIVVAFNVRNNLLCS